MSRVVQAAVVQMDVVPAPTTERLSRAERLVEQAAQEGAQLVVLPEVFNTGYAYTDDNYPRAEPMDGPTVTWMKRVAAQWDVHLCGSLMLLDQDEIYNAMLLFAPDGRMWRYDKNYPWAWERCYFREGDRITVAHTDLGDLGMLICWDVAHPSLWRRYAGRVDMMLISSSPPNFGHATLCFADGDRVAMADLAKYAAGWAQNTVRQAFLGMIRRQSAWLGIPVVGAMHCGRFQSTVPDAWLPLSALSVLSPRLIKHLSQADRAHITCQMVEGTMIGDGQGQCLQAMTNEHGEGVALAEVALAEKRLAPKGRQPAAPDLLPAYLLFDDLLPWLCVPRYCSGTRRAWGKEMAPVRASTRWWAVLLGLAAVLGFVWGLLWKKRRR